jgi:hypothetical protein
VVEGARLESVCAQQCTGGSNPPLSAIDPLVLITGNRASDCRPTPSGPEGSSGKWLVTEPRHSQWELKGLIFF